MSSLEYDEKTVAWLDPKLQQGFTQIPNAVLMDPRITLQARMAFAVLSSFAWQTDSCWPGQARVAGIMGVSERQLRRLFAELQRHKLLQVRKRGKTQPNVYRLLPEPSSDRTSEPSSDRTPTSYKEDTEKNRKRYEVGNTRESADG